MLSPAALLTVLGALAAVTHAATPAQWRSRSIYQVLTDRFARTDGSTTAACNTGDRTYCGGTYRGIINKLDYIQDMGFTAIWISPIVKNIESTTAYGEAFHGYWAQDIFSLNANFGTAADLQALSAALHARGMYLMVDVVPNHFAYAGVGASTNFSSFYPFGSSSYFHPFCWITNYDNQTNVEDCWLGDDNVALADVDTELAAVQAEYNTWIAALVSNYSIDGLRIDTVKHIEKPFWSSFNAAAGVYAVGEVYDGDYTYMCPYQSVLDGVLNYPMYYPLVSAFASTSGSISDLVAMVENIKDNCADSTLLGTFSENHDQPRFASYTSDISLAKNLIAYNIMGDGIPIIYEGQEQHYSGIGDPYNREAVWLSGYSTTATLYTHIASLNQLRNRAIYALGEDYTTYKAWVVASGSSWLALRKGPDAAGIITVLTNVGASGSSFTVSIGSTGYTAGATILDIVGCGSVTAGSGGTISVTLTGGLPVVYYPSAEISGTGICGL